MNVEIVKLFTIFIPIAVLIGIAAASISYTAWYFIVPLCFVGFGFDVYNALFLSIIIDLINGAILTVIYARNDRVNFKDGFIWAAPTLTGTAIGYFFSNKFLTTNPNVLKGGIGYFLLIIGAYFIVKGLRDLKRMRSIIHRQGTPYQDSIQCGKLLLAKIALPSVITGMVISGALGGLLGMGSGANFAIILLFFLTSYDLSKATGTGAFLMLILMAVCLGLFIKYVDFSFLWLYLVLLIPFSSAATLISAKYMVNVSKEKLSLLVGIVIILVALLSSIQRLFL